MMLVEKEKPSAVFGDRGHFHVITLEFKVS